MHGRPPLPFSPTPAIPLQLVGDAELGTDGAGCRDTSLVSNRLGCHCCCRKTWTELCTCRRVELTAKRAAVALYYRTEWHKVLNCEQLVLNRFATKSAWREDDFNNYRMAMAMEKAVQGGDSVMEVWRRRRCGRTPDSAKVLSSDEFNTEEGEGATTALEARAPLKKDSRLAATASSVRSSQKAMRVKVLRRPSRRGRH